MISLHVYRGNKITTDSAITIDVKIKENIVRKKIQFDKPWPNKQKLGKFHKWRSPEVERILID